VKIDRTLQIEELPMSIHTEFAIAQGIRPATWWEKDRAVKATRNASVLWAVLLAALIGLILLLRKS